jgi:hypothetical protein
MPSAKAKKKSSKPTTCPKCGGVDLVRKITTYPVLLSGPLEGKQVHVGRVAPHECLTCGHLMPTPAGQAKVDRNVEMGSRLFPRTTTLIGYRHSSTLPHACRKLTELGPLAILCRTDRGGLERMRIELPDFQRPPPR